MRRAAGVQSPFTVVEVEPAAVAVARHGAGAPVLCLTATGHGGRDFDAFVAQASVAGYEVVVVDWPGHGASPDAPPQFKASAAAYSRLLEGLISRLWPDGRKPVILGNSIGGAAALQFAADHPGRVRALVLCNPGGLAPLNPLARAYIHHKSRWFARGAAGDPGFPRAFARYYRGVLKRAPAHDQRDRIVAGGGDMAAILSQAWRSFAEPQADLRGRVADLDCPVLYAWAREDLIVSWRAARKAIEATPQHRLRLFPGGHSPFLEAPELFFQAFTAFLDSPGDPK